MLRKRWMPSLKGPKSKTSSGSTETILEIRLCKIMSCHESIIRVKVSTTEVRSV